MRVLGGKNMNSSVAKPKRANTPVVMPAHLMGYPSVIGGNSPYKPLVACFAERNFRVKQAVAAPTH
jgi:hypothetical protein